MALPWGDSDTAALAHLQQTSLIETAARRTQESAIVKVGAPTSVSWLASSVADTTTVNALAQPDSTIIASPESLPPPDDLTYTPSGLGTSGDHAVLIPEQSLSGALTGQDAKPTASDQGTPTTQSAQASALDTRQLLRSDSAILARQAPALERDIVVAMPRRAASAVQSPRSCASGWPPCAQSPGPSPSLCPASRSTPNRRSRPWPRAPRGSIAPRCRTR